MERDQEKKQADLAAEVRDRGISPERDLWPEISEKIGGPIGISSSTGPAAEPQPWWRRSVIWRAAAAAVVVLILAWGSVQILGPGTDPVLEGSTLATSDGTVTPGTDPTLSPGGTEDGTIALAAAGDLATIDAALAELKVALQLDPGNNVLNRLLQRLQRSRGSLVCKLIR